MVRLVGMAMAQEERRAARQLRKWEGPHPETNSSAVCADSGTVHASAPTKPTRVHEGMMTRHIVRNRLRASVGPEVIVPRPTMRGGIANCAEERKTTEAGSVGDQYQAENEADPNFVNEELKDAEEEQVQDFFKPTAIRGNSDRTPANAPASGDKKTDRDETCKEICSEGKKATTVANERMIATNVNCDLMEGIMKGIMHLTIDTWRLTYYVIKIILTYGKNMVISYAERAKVILAMTELVKDTIIYVATDLAGEMGECEMDKQVGAQPVALISAATKEGYGCNLALTSPRPAWRRCACIPVASKSNDLANSPGLNSSGGYVRDIETLTLDLAEKLQEDVGNTRNLRTSASVDPSPVEHVMKEIKGDSRFVIGYDPLKRPA